MPTEMMGNPMEVIENMELMLAGFATDNPNVEAVRVWQNNYVIKWRIIKDIQLGGGTNIWEVALFNSASKVYQVNKLIPFYKYVMKEFQKAGYKSGTIIKEEVKHWQ